ncbi:MAG: SEC-C metal-binding domain-containing protein [Nocardioidaceae bacterium]
MRTEELDRLDRDITAARSGPAEAYARALERGLAACEADAAAAEYLDVLELHSDLAETYDRLGRVEDALRHADVLADQGYACMPDPRCRRAEILTRHGRFGEAAAIWDAVARDTPDDVWVHNNAGLEYQAVGEHEIALSWLTRALEVAVRTGDPERLIGQLRDLRAGCLSALGREPDDLQTAEPVRPGPAPTPPARLVPPVGEMAGAGRDPAEMMPVTWAWAWLPAEEYPALVEHWPDLADSALVQDEDLGGLVTHVVYCQRMEQQLREAREAGMTGLRIAPVRSTELRQWVAVADNDPDERDPARLRARYAAHLGRDDSRSIAWPPGRNEPCWCGSGRKYKKCCGVPVPGGSR